MKDEAGNFNAETQGRDGMLKAEGKVVSGMVKREEREGGGHDAILEAKGGRLNSEEGGGLNAKTEVLSGSGWDIVASGWRFC